MNTKQTSNAVRVGALAVVALLCLPVASMAVTGLMGTVQSVNRDLNYFTILDQSGRSVKIDVRNLDTRQSINVWNLRTGDRVNVNGDWENGNTFRALTTGYSNGVNPMEINDPNTLYGTVDNINRNLKFITVRDQATGRKVKVDVRNMDTRQSVNVWQLRTGDTIVVNGGWANNRNRFTANRVNVSNQPMTSGYGYNNNNNYNNNRNFIGGTVQNTNRDLNYVTVRDDATGQLVKIDVRRMDTRRSVNVWNLRAGDRVSVNGSWENGTTFQADTVNF